MNNQLLNDKIEESKMSKTSIAEELGLTRQGLYNKLDGTREFKGSEIYRLYLRDKVQGVTVADITHVELKG